MQRKRGHRDRQCGGKPAGIWPHKLSATQKKMSPGLPILPERFPLFFPTSLPPLARFLLMNESIWHVGQRVHSWGWRNVWIRALTEAWIAATRLVIKLSFDIVEIFRLPSEDQLGNLSDSLSCLVVFRLLKLMRTLASRRRIGSSNCPLQSPHLGGRKVKHVWFVSCSAD